MSYAEYLELNLDRLMHHPCRLGIKQIFQEAAHNANTHQRLKKQLNECYAEDVEQFKIEFAQCLTIMFVGDEKLAGLQTSLDFASTYIVEFDAILLSEESQEEGLVTPVFNFIFAVHDSSNTNLRLRACEFLNQCLKKMGDQACLDQDVYDRIATTMLERLQDRKHTVRAQAIMALRRIQEPTNKDCKIVKAFMFHMENDPNAMVRAVVVKHIGFNSVVMPLLFDRIRDVDMEVKKAAFKTIARAKIARFTIRQRQEILRYGMLNLKVKSYAIDTVLMTWFQRTNCSFVDFLHLLHVETLDEEVTENILFALFEKEPLTNLKDLVKGWQKSDKLIPISELTCENVTVWRFLTCFLCVEGAKEENFDEDIILEILPNLSPFATYIEEYYNTCDVITFDNKYIMKQLLEIALFYPYSDEMGREKMKNLCIRFMVKEDELTFYPNVAKIMKKVVPDVNERFSLMAEAISDIRNPLDEPAANSEAVSELENRMDDLSFSTQEIPENEELKSDIRTLVKCLTIILEFLKLPDVRTIGSTLMTLKNTFVVNCLASTDPMVIKLAKSVMSLYCVWNKELARAEFLNYCLLANDVNNGPEALGTIFDILIVHGLNLYDDPPESPKAKSTDLHSINDFGSDETLVNPQVRQLIGLLISLLNHHDNLIKIKVAEGICKLILAGHITSPKVLSHITLFWLDPEFDKDEALRQYLGRFFTVLSRKKKGTALMILNSFFPTLKAFSDAEHSKSLVQVDQAEVPKLLLGLIYSGTVAECVDFKTLGSYHYRLCVMILDEMQFEVFPFPVLAKSLQYISLDLMDGQFANILMEKTDAIIEMELGDKPVAKILQTFRRKLDDWKAQYDKVNKITVINESDESNSEPVPRKKPRPNRRKKGKENTTETCEPQTQLAEPMIRSSDVQEVEDPVM